MTILGHLCREGMEGSEFIQVTSLLPTYEVEHQVSVV